MIRLNEYHVDFQNDVKNNKRNIYHPSGKKKYKMYFENLKGKERRTYMEEKNLREYNIAEMNAQQFRTLSKDTQTKILGELIEKYRSDSEIARHIKIGRCTLRELRKELGFAPAKPGNYNRESNPAPRTRTAPASVIEEPQNLIEIKISLNECIGADLQKKLESVGLFLEEGKKYDVEFVLKEIVNK